MLLGVVVPQGWTGEFAGVPPATAWQRTLDVASQAESLGFESVWAFDHVMTIGEPAPEITFESFVALTAIAARVPRVRLGHLVMCAGFRNPALVAKMVSTLDVVSGGRVDLGIGSGWKENEWRPFGFGFPSTRERLGTLRDHLEVISRMFAPGSSTYGGEFAAVSGAINEPRGLQEPRIPIMVGGNGPEVTWRLAALFADELNLDSLTPAEVAEALPLIRARCEEIGRDPDSLPVSVHCWWEYSPGPGDARAEMLDSYRQLGLSRVMVFVRESAMDDDALESLAVDARRAGVHLTH
jgi:alkanesulfonate monooxygenase SsuD/methylene tetrahydromethanopterin reductase-like flavin-dependent oxidoreductase (luciferase family)